MKKFTLTVTNTNGLREVACDPPAQDIDFDDIDGAQLQNGTVLTFDCSLPREHNWLECLTVRFAMHNDQLTWTSTHTFDNNNDDGTDDDDDEGASNVAEDWPVPEPLLSATSSAIAGEPLTITVFSTSGFSVIFSTDELEDNSLPDFDFSPNVTETETETKPVAEAEAPPKSTPPETAKPASKTAQKRVKNADFYEDDNDENLICHDDVECTHETGKAILCRINDEDTWIPKSQVDSYSDVQGDGDSGKLVISRWLAEQNGWI